MRQFMMSAAMTVALLAGCQNEPKSEATCQLPKPGTIQSVNEYCPVVPADTVDPAVMTEWKGQQVGFCCKNCLPKWEKMSDAERDAALARVVAKGKIKT